MGRRGNWFKTVKKALSPKSKRKKDQKNKLSGKQKHPSSGSTPSGTVADQVPQPELVKLTCLENEECHHPCPVAVSISTAVTNSASAANGTAASAATQFFQPVIVTQLTRKSREEVAAIKIQSFFRGYLARTEMRTLRGLVRLKSLMESSVVNRQAANTLRCMQVLARVHSQIRSRRLRKLEENQALQKQLLQKHAKEIQNLQVGNEWNNSIQSKEQIEAKLLSKHEAAKRRERVLAYAFSHQKTWTNSSRSVNPLFTDPKNPTWGWSWLERWVAAQTWENHIKAEKDLNDENLSIKSSSCDIFCGEIKADGRIQLHSEANSPTASQSESHSSTFQFRSTPSKRTSVSRANKLKPSSIRKSLVPDDGCTSQASIWSDGLRRHSIDGLGPSVRDDESQTSSPALPSYMTFTESARAKSRLQGLLGAEKNGTPERASFSSAKKRLSYPISPAMSRRHSDPLKGDSRSNAESSISNRVSY